MAQKVVVGLFNASELAKKIARKKDFSSVRYETRRFPDKELYAKVGKVKGKDVFVVQTGYPSPNNALVETLLVCAECRDQKAKSITVVLPYVPYGRQDKKFHEGEAHSLKTEMEILKSVGVSRVVTVDAHFRIDYGDKIIFGLRNNNLSAGAALVNHIKKKFGIKEISVISPDFGASGLVNKAAKESGSEALNLKKKRSGDYDVAIEGELDVKDKNVVVLDDMISTGSTMLQAIEIARRAGAKKVFAAATHGIFGWDALDKLNRASDYLVTTDSILNPTSFISVAEVLEGEI